ncbi:MAG: bifunctional alpha,alpha-trehalose-phosphate synthase (UDP-forming)/trehalose-phosphatase, partial [Bdellovibrionota bacterium]
MARWITVANRLPFTLSADKKSVRTSSGGLVSALNGVKSKAEKIWIGCAPEGLSEAEWPTLEPKVSAKANGWKYRPVFVDEDVYDRYYNRFCNDVLWPLLHYQPELVQFDASAWKAYLEVNERIANEIAAFADDDDLVWIHDFHLFMVPKFLRKLRPTLRTGFFLHVPFPSSEVFRQLPVREQILDSLLEADLVGFHDYSYLQHFGSALLRLLGLESNFISVKRGGRTTRLGVFPVSIDTDAFMKKAKDPRVCDLAKTFAKPQFQFLGVDRLDYMKGIDLKLKAFKELLTSYPQYRGRVSLLQVAVPTRTGVPVYMELARETARLVGEINGAFSTPTWTPIQYLHSSVTEDQLLALYAASDALLVSSKRDGMNLVALEYIAAQREDRPGVVLLSEFAGAISTLSHVLAVNPWDFEDTAKKMIEAMEMAHPEKLSRQQTMQRYLAKYTATHWATSFIDELARGEPSGRSEGPPMIQPNAQAIELLSGRILAAHVERIVLFIDYDGTLTPIRSRPEDAILDETTRSSLKQWCHYDWLDLVVMSGRDSAFLSEQMGVTRCILAAEHGAKTFDPATGRWQKRVHSDRSTWFPAALKTMSDYSARVPGSHIEKKQFSIAWHYRNAPTEFGEFQARKLAEELELGLANLPVNILR